MNIRNTFRAAALCLALAPGLPMSPATAQETPSFSRGQVQTTGPELYACAGGRPTAVGKIVSEDGKQWTVPAATNFRTARKAPDLYNSCTGVRRRGLSEADLQKLPVRDAGGPDVFTAYVFADNYFEFYVNGRLLAVDAVPFTPFNSSVVRFRAQRPFTVAVMGVDWEENLGVGTERSWRSPHHAGDAGFVAAIRDSRGKTVAITDASWRAQTFYIAPLQDRACLGLKGPVRDSSRCATAVGGDGNALSAAFWPVPPGWFASGFDDSRWPQAVVFTNDTVGVDNKPAYTNFRDVFDAPDADARFIWSSNLILDNLVLMRKTVE